MREVSKLVKDNVSLLTQLEPQEFVGVCKILGVKLTSEEQEEGEDAGVLLSVRPTEELMEEVVEKIYALNRVQGRNLRRLLKAATKGNH